MLAACTLVILLVVATAHHQEQAYGVMQASNLVAQVSSRPDLVIKYQACYARIADSKRRFLDAAMKYYELSQTPSAAGCTSPFMTRCCPTCFSPDVACFFWWLPGFWTSDLHYQWHECCAVGPVLVLLKAAFSCLLMQFNHFRWCDADKMPALQCCCVQV
jgi:hypothetical protein